MSMSPPMSSLMQAHAACQMGFYFDTVMPVSESVFVCTSLVIKDPFWNYAYFLNYAQVDLNAVLRATEPLPAMARRRAVLLPDDCHLALSSDFLSRFEPFSGDQWMVANRSDLPSLPDQQIDVQMITTSVDQSDAAAVFADAYTSLDEEGVGYTGLPQEYLDAYANGLRNASSFGSEHFLGRKNGEAVAIASCHYADGLVGLYNVAVRRDARAQGIGTAISIHALRRGFTKRDTAFLQTEPQSPVQRMYEKMGFAPLGPSTIWQERES